MRTAQQRHRDGNPFEDHSHAHQDSGRRSDRHWLDAAQHRAPHAAAYSVGIGVGGNGASAGYVSYAGTSYRVELVASGSGTCTLTNAPVVIGGVGAGMNSASVAGAPCTIYDGQATYEMVYYAVGSLLPIGGWYRECTWALGIKTCSVEGTSLPL